MTTKNIPAFLAHTQFGQILERVSKDKERFVVTKKGEATAVILGIEDFLRATADAPESVRVLQEQAQKSGASKLTLEEFRTRLLPSGQSPRKEYDSGSLRHQCDCLSTSQTRQDSGLTRVTGTQAITDDALLTETLYIPTDPSGIYRSSPPPRLRISAWFRCALSR